MYRYSMIVFLFKAKNLVKLTVGQRPSRSGALIVEANPWNLIQECWKQRPSLRPSMETVAAQLLA